MQAPPKRKGSGQISGCGINWKSSSPSRPRSHSDRVRAASFSRTKLFQSQKCVFYTLGMWKILKERVSCEAVNETKEQEK